MKNLKKVIKKFKISDRKLLIIIILILTLPYIYNFTSSAIKNYTERRRIHAIQVKNEERRIAEQQKQQETDRKIDTLIKQYGIVSLTSDGLPPSILKYLDAKSTIDDYYKDFRLSCEDLKNGVKYKPDSSSDLDLSYFTRDWAIRDCQVVEATKNDYEQFVKERELINKLISEHKDSIDVDIKEYVRILSFNLSNIDFKMKFLH